MAQASVSRSDRATRRPGSNTPLVQLIRQVRLPASERERADADAFLAAQIILINDVSANWTGLYARLPGPNGDPDLVYELCGWLELAGRSFLRDAAMIEANPDGDKDWARAARARGYLFETAGRRAARLAQALCGVEPPPLPDLPGKNTFSLSEDEPQT